MLLQVIVSDKWKDGANNTLEGGGKKVNENKALSKKKQWQPYSAKCTVGLPVLLPSHFRISCDRIPCTLLAQTCKTSITKDYKYCQPCSYRKGLCAICGKQVGGGKMLAKVRRPQCRPALMHSMTHFLTFLLQILDTKGYKQSVT